MVGQGGFGGPRSSAKVIPTIPEPNRQPDKVSDKKTSIDQVLCLTYSTFFTTLRLVLLILHVGSKLNESAKFSLSLRKALKFYDP